MAIVGTIAVEILTDEENPSIPLSVCLDGEGEHWIANGEGLHLTPGQHPGHYIFTLELNSPSSFSLVGVRIFRNDIDSAKIVLSATSSGQVYLELIDAIPHHGEQVIYKLSIGINSGTTQHWLEPSIAFEPQME